MGHLRLPDRTNIDDIDLSNTLNVGEAVYRGVADRMLPSGFCIDL